MTAVPFSKHDKMLNLELGITSLLLIFNAGIVLDGALKMKDQFADQETWWYVILSVSGLGLCTGVGLGIAVLIGSIIASLQSKPIDKLTCPACQKDVDLWMGLWDGLPELRNPQSQESARR